MSPIRSSGRWKDLELPMLGACFTAMLVPTLVRDKPIYEALRENLLHSSRASHD